MQGPNPDTLYPIAGYPRTAFLKNVVTRPNIKVGDYSYYDDPHGAERWEENNVLYHFEFTGDQLVIGRFVAIATGARFIMNGANHLMTGFSTFPFATFGGGWEEGFDFGEYAKANRGDTNVGNDVWIGNGATILPGVTIGDGAVIGAGAVVGTNVPPYGVVVGNPAKLVRKRFDEATIARLLDIAWWDWSADKLTTHLNAIRGADLAALEAAASS